ncbi:hypothetical protein LTR17_019428 [Elasticomyces elasticus]|nr:hypothetical protein LTR17_019428 [Elasticomyces elasticus]
MAALAADRSGPAQSPNTLARTLVAGANARYEPATSEEVKSYWSLRSLLDLDEPDISTHGTPSGNAAMYYTALRRFSDGRRVFGTEAGRLGVGPQLMRNGDIIVIMMEVVTPIVLRRDGQLYHLVGECYVDGRMFGESVREHKAAGLEDEVFRIS